MSQLNIAATKSFLFSWLIHSSGVRRFTARLSNSLHTRLLFQAFYFDRSDVALQGLHSYFKKCSDEEREHAMKFMTYQNKRGGNIRLTQIERPSEDNWESAKTAMMEALHLEKRVNQCLLELHALASTHNDPNLLDFLETEFLQEQVDAIKELANHVTNLERVAEGLGVYIFDKELGH